ncbi:hypothetical protein QQP08_009116 [Theobroma cacao]|nr:hypothetical protein QQP08_009116 [Theobroma cacao]
MVSEKRIYWLSKAFGLGKQCKCPTVQGVGPKSGEWSRRCYAGHRRLDSKPAKPVHVTRCNGNNNDAIQIVHNLPQFSILKLPMGSGVKSLAILVFYISVIYSACGKVESSPYTRLCGTKEILTVNGEFPGPNIESS